MDPTIRTHELIDVTESLTAVIDRENELLQELRIKEIGAKARAELAELMGRKVHLFLHVKVKENWDEDRGVYRDMGLDWVD